MHNSHTGGGGERCKDQRNYSAYFGNIQNNENIQSRDNISQIGRTMCPPPRPVRPKQLPLPSQTTSTNQSLLQSTATPFDHDIPLHNSVLNTTAFGLGKVSMHNGFREHPEFEEKLRKHLPLRPNPPHMEQDPELRLMEQGRMINTREFRKQAMWNKKWEKKAKDRAEDKREEPVNWVRQGIPPEERERWNRIKNGVMKLQNQAGRTSHAGVSREAHPVVNPNQEGISFTGMSNQGQKGGNANRRGLQSTDAPGQMQPSINYGQEGHTVTNAPGQGQPATNQSQIGQPIHDVPSQVQQLKQKEEDYVSRRSGTQWYPSSRTERKQMLQPPRGNASTVDEGQQK